MPSSSGHDALVEQARVVKARHTDRLMAVPGVVGVGVGLRQKSGQLTDDVAIVVMVRNKLALNKLSPGEVLPRELDGIPVDVQETGEIRARLT